MVKTCLLLLGFTTLICGGCVSGKQVKMDHVAPSVASSPAADIWIISATYGSGTAYSDVTARVNDLLHQTGVEFFARPEWLNADPTPGWNKALVIVYEFKGRRHIFTTGEGGSVSVESLIQLTDK